MQRYVKSTELQRVLNTWSQIALKRLVCSEIRSSDGVIRQRLMGLGCLCGVEKAQMG